MQFDHGTTEELFNFKGEFVEYFIHQIKSLMERESVYLNDIRNVELVRISYADGDCEFKLYINTNDKTLFVKTPNLRNIQYKQVVKGK